MNDNSHALSGGVLEYWVEDITPLLLCSNTPLRFLS
jgi:hypothetical protein